jgi:6-phosphofructokinase 1
MKTDNKVTKIGVLTSGGDAPGMNAVIRAVVRSACDMGIEVTGIRRGYEGLLSGDILEMDSDSVSEIIQKGGTMLLTARSAEMLTEEGQKRSAGICKVLGLDCLVVIGGDGSIRGARDLAKLGINVMCIPATIDLDLACTDYTIGFDTAVNTAMECINRLRDTSSSHERCSVVEVMGRKCGQLALWSAMTGGAEEVLLPESETTTEEIIKIILSNRSKGKKHNLIVVAEGAKVTTIKLAKAIQDITGIESRPSILGYLQRGGAPTALDRVHASMMGYKAVEAIKNGAKNRVVVLKHGEYIDIDIEEALNSTKEYDGYMYNVIKSLSI